MFIELTTISDGKKRFLNTDIIKYIQPFEEEHSIVYCFAHSDHLAETFMLRCKESYNDLKNIILNN